MLPPVKCMLGSDERQGREKYSSQRPTRCLAKYRHEVEIKDQFWPQLREESLGFALGAPQGYFLVLSSKECSSLSVWVFPFSKRIGA